MEVILNRQFEDEFIDFQLDKANVMVNATQMAKIFGAQVNEFMSNDKTQAFIDECLKNGNSRFISVEKREDLVTSRQKSGTWMHRILALKFAAWLSPRFELWVYSTIDQILFQHYRELEDSLRKSAERKDEIERLEQDLATDDRYIALEQLKLEEKRAAAQRSAINRQQLTLFREGTI